MAAELNYDKMSDGEAKFMLMTDNPFDNQEDADNFFDKVIDRIQDYELYRIYATTCMNVGYSGKVPSSW